MNEPLREEITSRYPMYQANEGFEQWLNRKAGDDPTLLEHYFALLEDYGTISGDGTIADDYTTLPDPTEVVADINRRLASLPPDTLDLLKRASVEGESFGRDAVAGSSGGDIPAALQPAIDAGVLKADRSSSSASGSTVASTSYRFVPMQTARVLYMQIPEEERGGYHSAVVERLSAQRGDEKDQGAQDMLNQLISEHNRRTTRPYPPEEKG